MWGNPSDKTTFNQEIEMLANNSEISFLVQSHVLCNQQSILKTIVVVKENTDQVEHFVFFTYDCKSMPHALAHLLIQLIKAAAFLDSLIPAKNSKPVIAKIADCCTWSV